MASSWSNESIASEAEDLMFRHRTLMSAQRILEAELNSTARPSNRDNLYVQRLRRLKTYIRTSVTALERRMKDLGIVTTDDAGPRHDPPLPPSRNPDRYASATPAPGSVSSGE